MASIRKRGSKWQAQVRRSGQPSVSQTFRLKSDAETWARHVETDMDRNGLPAHPRKLQRIRVADLIERYRDTVVAKKRSREVETFILNAMLRQRLARVRLSDLTPAIFSAYRDERLNRVKPVTIRRELGLLQHIFTVAQREWGITLPSNPVSGISKPNGSKPRDRRLQDGELGRLLTHCSASRNKLLSPIILFAIETGMRRGEILKTSWTNIDWESRTLHIPETKNGHPRTIPLSKAAVAVLERPPRRQGDLVFPTSASALQQAWKRLTKRAGRIPANICP